MPKKSTDKETRKAIRNAKGMIEQVMRNDANEAETRRRVERIFENVLGYDVLTHLSRERAVQGAGETEHVDFTINLEGGPDAKPVVMVELKRVGVDLALKHLKQVTSYAIDTGCEWIILTNGREWRLYHVEFGQPPVTTLLDDWNLLTDEPADLAVKFELISYKNIRSGGLDKLWLRTKVLEPRNLLTAILSEPSLRYIRKHLRQSMGVGVGVEEIVQGIRKLLNEAAAIEMDSISVKLQRKKRTPKRAATVVGSAQPSHNNEMALATKHENSSKTES